jgi:hypothetical protein
VQLPKDFRSNFDQQSEANQSENSNPASRSTGGSSSGPSSDSYFEEIGTRYKQVFDANKE